MNKRILVIQAARFGDLAQTRRLVASLSQQTADLHLAVDHSLAPLARILYPYASVHGFSFHGSRALPNTLPACEAAFAELRELNFDEVYNCNFSPLTAAMCRIFEPERIVGYRPAHDSSGGILRSPWCRLGFRLSARRYASPLNLADFWAWFSSQPIAPNDVNPPAKGAGGGIGIAVSGRELRRSLPVEALAIACQTTFRIMDGCKIRIFGTQAEAQRARKLMCLFPSAILEKTTNLCGKTDWLALHEQMQGLDLLLCPDTGLMHLACHLGVPVLAFFLSSAWCHETGPYGLGHAVMQTAPVCAPCLESATCQNGEICRSPYSGPQFAKAVTTALGAAPSASEWPAAFQLWRSGFDDLGCFLRLEAGSDKFAVMRQQARAFVKNYLGFGPIADSASELMPASEWMLPPWRYC